jgi:hypothetical protein
MKSRSDSPGFLVDAHGSQEFPGHTYVPWKFPTKVRTRSSKLWIWLAGRCSSHVHAESARCSGRLRMMTSSVVAPPMLTVNFREPRVLVIHLFQL